MGKTAYICMIWFFIGALQSCQKINRPADAVLLVLFWTDIRVDQKLLSVDEGTSWNIEEKNKFFSGRLSAGAPAG